MTHGRIHPRVDGALAGRIGDLPRAAEPLRERPQRERVVELRDHDAPAPGHAPHLRERLADVRDMGEHFERTGDVECPVVEREARHAPFAHVEPSLARFLEHPGGQIDPLGRTREAGDPLEEQPCPAAALEDVAPGAVAFGEVDLEPVEERVVAARVVAVALVRVGELVVVGAGVSGGHGRARFSSTAHEAGATNR